jgi:hypothetical protein
MKQSAWFLKQIKKRVKARKSHKRRDKLLYNIAYLHGLLNGVSLRRPVFVISHLDMLVGNAENGVKICHTNNEKNQI